MSATGAAPAPAAPAPTSRAQWLALTWLALATLLAMSTWFSGTAVVRQLRDAWQLSPSTAAWLTIAVQLGFVAGAFVAAFVNLSDIAPPKRVLWISCLCTAAVNAGFAFAPNAAVGIPLRFATGFFLAGVYPTGLKLMATWFAKNRGRALGIMVGALTLGSAAPHLVNAFGGVGWRTVVLATSALTVVGGVIAATAVGEGPYPFSRARFDPSQAGRVLHDRGVRLACLGYFGHMWELYAMWAWFLVFFDDSFRANSGRVLPHVASLASLATFAVIGAGFVGSWLFGIWSDRWGRAEATIWAMTISGACALGIGFTFGMSPWIVLAVGLVWGASVVADSAQFSTLVTELADPSYVGTALTLQLGIGFTLTIATIWLMPIVRDAVSWRWAFAVLVPGPVVGIWAMRGLVRRGKGTQQ